METSKLSIRLSEVVADILMSIDHLCTKNGIQMGEGLLGQVEEGGQPPSQNQRHPEGVLNTHRATSEQEHPKTQQSPTTRWNG